jgi:hypothetical protein
MRCVNVVNFIREIEPRFPMDMMLPVRSQMELIRQKDLPATWLLQYDALVSGPFVPFLKERMAKSHEVGFWFEMNEKHVKAAGIQWRGRPGYEWDFNPCIAFTIGYSPEERIKLADTAMETFHKVWGRYPSSVASWNLDSITVGHLANKYGVDAFATCRDQAATDGFTIWGAPIAGYYPAKTNCWAPAIDKANQIGSPVFRMLGQDPVYYYDMEWEIPGGRKIREPDTMEPVWTSGRSSRFVETFLQMISDAPTGRFAYAQLGQENTFPWDQQAEAYPKQMKALAELRKSGKVHVETMGESGRRFKRSFPTTPVQSQVQLNDPFGNEELPAKSIWFQSRYYRANLHIAGSFFYLRDVTVYNDKQEQPFLRKATRDSSVEQRALAVLDGYHWRKSGGQPGAGGFFTTINQPIFLLGDPKVTESGNSLVVELPVQGGATLRITFDEKSLTAHFIGFQLHLAFDWDASKSSFVGIDGHTANYRLHDFAYSVPIEASEVIRDAGGWKASSPDGKIVLRLAQM